MLLVIGTYFGCYIAARTKAEKGEFDAASALLFAAPVTKLHDAKLVAYIEAGRLMTSHNYEEANLEFQELSGFLNADDMAKEAKYRRAFQYADADDFNNAIRLMDSLSGEGYRDSAERALELQFRKGVYLLREENKFDEANKIFSMLAKKGYDGAEEMQYETQYVWALYLVDQEQYVLAYKKLAAIRNYADARECKETLSDLMYSKAQALYRAGHYKSAEKLFECISLYKDSKKYLTLIRARGKLSTQENLTNIVKEVVSIFYFEDAPELLVSEGNIACYFLLGTWWTSRGEYYFKMERANNGEYNFLNSYTLPSFGGLFTIEDGVYSVSGDGYKNKPQYRFTLLTPDSMEVYCYKNGATYTLYRAV